LAEYFKLPDRSELRADRFAVPAASKFQPLMKGAIIGAVPSISFYSSITPNTNWNWNWIISFVSLVELIMDPAALATASAMIAPLGQRHAS
jgi:hypothetical protein